MKAKSKKRKYRTISLKKWGCWDIIGLQLILCLLLGGAIFAGAKFGYKPTFSEDVEELLQQGKNYLNRFISHEKLYDLTYPLSGTVSSFFGERKHPISGEEDFHEGIDIAAAEGTAVHAAADGVVTFSGWDGAYGYRVALQHSKDFSTSYAHCSRIIAKEGDVIRRGERIALCGSTGQSTGPHVHFSCELGGVNVDPMEVL